MMSHLAGLSVATYPVVLAGDLTVGKTSIWRALQGLSFLENTSGFKEPNPAEYNLVVKLTGGQVVTLLVVDTGGAEKDLQFTLSRYHHASAIVFVYAVDNTDSFQSIPAWIKVGAGWLRDDYLRFVIGNKTDLKGEPGVVDLRDQYSLIRTQHLDGGYETSAKDNPKYIIQSFSQIAQALYKRFSVG